jgi:Protein of unknown function (DUF2783)
MLNLENAFPDPDVAYRTIVEAHRNLTEAESAALNATLVLLLANHIGDLQVVATAVKLARQQLLANPIEVSLQQVVALT